MGTIKKGILGGFSGKVGTVVGSSWKGISYMRSLPQKVRNPRTEPQMSHRSKFAITLSYLKPLNGVLRTGWKLYANRQSPLNAAMSYTIANAIAGTYPDYSIDPSKVLVSRGSLTPAVNVIATPVSAAINFEWDDNSDLNNANQTDRALLAVLNSAKSEAIFDVAGATRYEATQSLSVPANWSGDSVEVYVGFISEDGKEIANSVYVGNLVIA